MTLGEAMHVAQSMRTGKWTVTEIQRYLAEHGVERSWPTVKRWADPAFNDADNERCRGRMRDKWAAQTAGRLGRRGDTLEYQEARARQLATVRVSYSSIARVMAFDYPEHGWDRSRVEALLGPARAMKEARDA